MQLSLWVDLAALIGTKKLSPDAINTDCNSGEVMCLLKQTLGVCLYKSITKRNFCSEIQHYIMLSVVFIPVSEMQGHGRPECARVLPIDCRTCN